MPRSTGLRREGLNELPNTSQDLQSGDADGEQVRCPRSGFTAGLGRARARALAGAKMTQVPQERGSLDDPMPPRASAAADL